MFEVTAITYIMLGQLHTKEAEGKKARGNLIFPPTQLLTCERGDTGVYCKRRQRTWCFWNTHVQLMSKWDRYHPSEQVAGIIPSSVAGLSCFLEERLLGSPLRGNVQCCWGGAHYLQLSYTFAIGFNFLLVQISANVGFFCAEIF